MMGVSMGMELAYQIVGIVLGSLVGYAAIVGFFYTIFTKYNWFAHNEHSFLYCTASCDRDKASSGNRWLAAAFWWAFVIPLFFGWLVLVARWVAAMAMKKKNDFPTAKVVEKD